MFVLIFDFLIFDFFGFFGASFSPEGGVPPPVSRGVVEGTFVVRLGADGGGSSKPIGTYREKGEGRVGIALVISVLLRLRQPRE